MRSESSSPPTEDTRAFYDDVWKKYGHLDAKSPAAFHRRRLVVQLARDAVPGAKRVLDVGCGQGELIADLASGLPSTTVDGADVSQQSLHYARNKSPAADLFLLDLSASDFAERNSARLGRYDLVVASEVLEHIADDARAAKNLGSLIRPGGAAIVTVPGGKMSRFDEIIGHHRHYGEKRLEGLLSGAGFEVERVFGWGFPFHSIYRTAVRVASRASMPETNAPKESSGRLQSVLGSAYSVFGSGLKPLFYLNLSRWGEQMFAVGLKR
jgi:SAM-dependent methyltransferase